MNRIISENKNRLEHEKKTIRAMIGIYCRGNHSRNTDGDLCEQCQKLLDYARGRLDRCPFGESKSTCAKCSVHCYKPSLREQIKAVMRYAGPRMIWRHPLLAIQHCYKEYRSKKKAVESNPCHGGKTESASGNAAQKSNP